MSSEYLTRREFNKRVVVGSAVAAVGMVDMSNTNSKSDRIEEESKKEVIERGINPTSQADKTLQTKEEKAQQEKFDKAVQKRSREKKDLGYDLRVLGNRVLTVGGLFVVFNAMFRKRPS